MISVQGQIQEGEGGMRDRAKVLSIVSVDGGGGGGGISLPYGDILHTIYYVTEGLGVRGGYPMRSKFLHSNLGILFQKLLVVHVLANFIPFPIQ